MTRSLKLFWPSLAVLLTTACAGSSPRAPGFETADPAEGGQNRALMLRHFDHARALSSAAVFWRPAQARTAAQAIRQEGPVMGLPPEAEREYEAFLASVDEVERAGERRELARSAARMARQCGACHMAAGLGPQFSIGRPVEPVTLEDHIAVLAWGSARMWESLIGGSDLAWRAGARALSGEVLREDLYRDRVPDLEAARALTLQLHELGVRALAASEPDARAAVLGEVWGTCSGCHEMIGLTAGSVGPA